MVLNIMTSFLAILILLAEVDKMFLLLRLPTANVHVKAFSIACSVVIIPLLIVMVADSMRGYQNNFVCNTIVTLAVLDLVTFDWHDFWKHDRIVKKARTKAMTFVQRTKHLRNKLASDNKKTAKRAGIPHTN